MKTLLLFLLLTTFCFAQHAKVTAYRLVNEHDDGPCSVKTYVKYPEQYYETYVTAESTDPVFVENLLKLKKEARKWERTNYNCSRRCIGCDMVHNMFVIKYNGSSDTILAARNNDILIFSEKEKAYLDKNEVLKKMFPENIKEFFEHDFETQVRSFVFWEENDSITADKVLYKGKRVHDFITKDFEYDTGNFRLASSDSLYGSMERKYAFANDTVRFYQKDSKAIISDPDSGWNIDGIKVGDREVAQAEISKINRNTKILPYKI